MNWQEITEDVHEQLQKAKERDINVWFRGQANTKWGIRSSLHRYIEDICKLYFAAMTDEQKETRLRQEYKSLYGQFRADAWNLLDAHERSDWGIIFSMQHYRIPTRLLDWTESFACAVYFAQYERKPGEDAVVYSLVPQAVNRLSLNRGQLKTLEETCTEDAVEAAYHPKFSLENKTVGYPATMAVAPFLSNPRMLAQRSVFTISGDSFLSLEQEFDGKLVQEGYLRKYTLSSDMFDKTEAFLDLVGIGDYGYFPDFEGLYRKVKSRKANQIRTSEKYHIKEDYRVKPE